MNKIPIDSPKFDDQEVEPYLPEFPLDSAKPQDTKCKLFQSNGYQVIHFVVPNKQVKKQTKFIVYFQDNISRPQAFLIGDFAYAHPKTYFKIRHRLVMIRNSKAALSFNKFMKMQHIHPTDENHILDFEDEPPPFQPEEITFTEKLLSFLKDFQLFLFRLFYVWSPDEPKRVFWDILSMLFIFIQMLTIPLIITFEITVQGAFSIFNSILDYFFLVDIIISFNTGFYKNGELLKQRSYIVINYIKFWFWIDLVASFPYDSVIQAEDDGTMKRNAQLLKFIRFLKFVKVIRLVRALKLKKIFAELEYHFSFGNALNSFLSFVKLCILIFCIAHWLACVWNLVIILHTNQQETWMGHNNILDTEWDHKYLDALYFSITTMITIGYGDIHPYTQWEEIYGVVVMIIASGVFGYSMNSIMVIFQSHEEVQDLKGKNAVLIKYIKQKDLPIKLQARVKNYIEWLSDQQQIARNFEQQIIDNLSINLKTEIVTLVQGKMISDVKFIKKLFSPLLISRLAYALTEKIQGPEEFVFSENRFQCDLDLENRCIYFIQNGSLSVITEDQKTTLAILNKGNYFGEIGFFSDVPRTASIQTLDFVNLMVLSRKDFHQLIVGRDRESSELIKYQIEMFQNFRILGLKCYFCREYGHAAKYCHHAHYKIGLFERLSVVKLHHLALSEKIKLMRAKRKKNKSLILFRNKKFIFHSHRMYSKADQYQHFLIPMNLKSESDLKKIDNNEQNNFTKSAMDGFIIPQHHKEHYFEKFKNYDSFLPNNNLDLIIQKANENASAIIQELLEKKERRKKDILEGQFRQKAQKVLKGVKLNILKKKMSSLNIQEIQQNNQKSRSNLEKSPMPFSTRDEQRQRLKEVQLRRKRKQKKLQDKWEKEESIREKEYKNHRISDHTKRDRIKSQNNFLEEQFNLELVSEGHPQQLKNQQPIKLQIISSNIMSQSQSSELKDQNTGAFSFETENISFKKSKSVDFDDRKEFKSKLLLHHKQVYENMIFLAINFKLLKSI